MSENTTSMSQQVVALVVDLAANRTDLLFGGGSFVSELVAEAVKHGDLKQTPKLKFLAVQVMYADDSQKSKNELQGLLSEAIGDIASGNTTGDASGNGVEVHCYARRTLTAAKSELSLPKFPSKEPQTTSIRGDSGVETAEILPPKARNEAPLNLLNSATIDENSTVSNTAISTCIPPQKIEGPKELHGPDEIAIDHIEAAGRRAVAQGLQEYLTDRIDLSPQSENEINRLLAQYSLGLRDRSKVHRVVDPSLLGRSSIEVVPLDKDRKSIAEAQDWFRNAQKSVMRPALDVELKALLKQPFDNWVQAVEVSEALDVAAEAIAVFTLLAVVGSKTKEIAIEYANKLLRAVAGKKIRKEDGIRVVEAIRRLEAAVGVSIHDEHGTVVVSAYEDSRYKFSMFSVAQTGVGKNDRKKTTNSRFGNFFLKIRETP